jgi:hypothetical protein
MPINNEEINDHPWLKSWNTIDEKDKIEVLKDRMKEIDDLLGTASIILILLVLILLGTGLIILISGLIGGSVTMSQVSQIGGMVKQFTGK